MRCFIAFSALIVAASALPTQIGNQVANFSDSRDPYFGLAGWATVNGGTQGGTGGAQWTVWDGFALRDALNSDSARVVTVRGRIDLTALFTASPGVILQVGSRTSLLGGDRNAEIFGGGLRIRNRRQIIIQDIKFNNALSYAPGERPNGQGGIANQSPGYFSVIDAIDIDGTTNVWVNHCEFSDDPWNAANTPRERGRHDGLLDVKSGADYISISNNMFRNHNLNSLVGHSDSNQAQDSNRLRVTYYNNWFRGTVQRNPRVRYGRVHILNNLYTDITGYGVGVGAGARIYLERNVFRNCNHAWSWASGVPNPIGNLRNVNNELHNSRRDSSIPNNVNWVPNDHYRVYRLDNVETHVRAHAGTR